MIKIILFLRKIIIALAPLVIFFLFKRGREKFPKNKSVLSDFDKKKIVEGEIITENV